MRSIDEAMADAHAKDIADPKLDQKASEEHTGDLSVREGDGEPYVANLTPSSSDESPPPMPKPDLSTPEGRKMLRREGPNCICDQKLWDRNGRRFHDEECREHRAALGFERPSSSPPSVPWFQELLRIIDRNDGSLEIWVDEDPDGDGFTAMVGVEVPPKNKRGGDADDEQRSLPRVRDTSRDVTMTPEEHDDAIAWGKTKYRALASEDTDPSPPPVPSVDGQMARIRSSIREVFDADPLTPHEKADYEANVLWAELRQALEENQDLDEHNLKMADAYAKDIGDLKHRAEKAERLYNTVEGTVGRLTQENELLESLVNRLEAESAKLRKMLREGVVLTDFLVGKSYSPAPGLAAWNKRVRALLTDKKGRVR